MTAEDYANALRKRVVAHLRLTKQTQNDLAKQLGVTNVTVSNFLTGKRIPTGETIFKIYEIINTTIN